MNNIGRSIDKPKVHKNKKTYGITFEIPLTFAFAIVILLLLTTSPITSSRQLIKLAEADKPNKCQHNTVK